MCVHVYQPIQFTGKRVEFGVEYIVINTKRAYRGHLPLRTEAHHKIRRYRGFCLLLSSSEFTSSLMLVGFCMSLLTTCVDWEKWVLCVFSSTPSRYRYTTVLHRLPLVAAGAMAGCPSYYQNLLMLHSVV